MFGDDVENGNIWGCRLSHKIGCALIPLKVRGEAYILWTGKASVLLEIMLKIGRQVPVQ